ncbi:OPT oligopeptide transporter protein-domain-containing protein [Multifurca ochricompacta]|uniref:OPT oligopeptide transporter protein-domain-containing protein n=1 Tax=Multifurca ochricompacta TaxID=376703 RepID=A0AAD4M861_9AGAM|nr:OPT oligopeptide transporter protein-domain-containing protein [Multifurca ochricompacta]
MSSASPEFTLRAVMLGLLIGCLLCFTNLYFGLQTGWISMMSLQSAIIGFLISKLLVLHITPQETVVLQTTAVATGTMPLAAGFVGIIPALSLLDEQKDGSRAITLTWTSAVAWSCAIAYFGVFMSPPIRKRVIVDEQLTFPSGTATAQVISVLHKLPSNSGLRRRPGYSPLNLQDEEPSPLLDSIDDSQDPEIETIEGVQNEGWSSLTWSFLASGMLTLAAYFFPVIFSLPLFGGYLARHWLWTFTPSLSYVGQGASMPGDGYISLRFMCIGIIMGFPTTLSMNFGMLIGWGVLSPLSKYYGWAPGPVGDMVTGARGWILWISLAIMSSDSLVSLIPVAREYIGKLTSNREAVETEDRLVPNRWVFWGIACSTVIGISIVWLVFGKEGIKPWATLISFVLGALLSILGVRALGETDLNPVSGLGKISQLLFAVIQPGNVVANIIAGGVAEAGAQQAQFYGQLIGSTLSIPVTVTAFILYNKAYTIPGPTFPAPTAYVWLSLARLLRDGSLPEKSAVFMLSFAIIFALISAFKTYASRRRLWYAKWIPSGVAFAIGFLNTPSFSLARLVGGIIEYIYYTRLASRGKSGDIKLIVVASGFVLGEGVMSVACLVLRTFGVGIVSCWGCNSVMCGGCPP